MTDEQTPIQARTTLVTPRSRPSAPQRRGNRWRIQWTDHSGERRSRTFQRREDARQELERVKGAARFVADGALPAPPPPMTFRIFVEKYYIPNRTMQKRDPKDDLSILRRHLYSVFENVLLSDLNRRAVDAFQAEKRDTGLGEKTIGNILTLLKSMLRYAEDLGFLLRAPKVKLPTPAERPYTYLRTPGEIQALLSAAMEEEDGVMQLLATAVYTGMRAGELFGLRWDDVNFDNRLICVARSFDRPATKSGKVRYVPILDVLFPILRDWRLRNPNRFVFPNKNGNMNTPNPHVCNFTFKRCLRLAGLPYMRFHDLRHTFASQWAMNGGSREKLQEILGHASPIMTQRYRHLEPQTYAQDHAIFSTAPRVTREDTSNLFSSNRVLIRSHLINGRAFNSV